MEVAAHGVHHGAAVGLAATHLQLKPKVDVRAMEPGFPSRAEVLKNINIGQLIIDFGTAADVVAAVVSVEQVIKETPC